MLAGSGWKARYMFCSNGFLLSVVQCVKDKPCGGGDSKAALNDGKNVALHTNSILICFIQCKQIH